MTRSRWHRGLQQVLRDCCSSRRPSARRRNLPLLHHHLHAAEAWLLPEQLQTVNTRSPTPSCRSPTASNLASMLGDPTSLLHMHHLNTGSWAQLALRALAGVSLQEEASLKHCLRFLVALYQLIFNKPVVKWGGFLQ